MSCRLYPPIYEGLILDHVFKEGSILARLYLEESTTHTGQQDNGVTYGPTNGVFCLVLSTFTAKLDRRSHLGSSISYVLFSIIGRTLKAAPRLSDIQYKA